MSNYKETGSKAYLYGICAVAVIGGLLFGYDTAVISGAEQALQKFFVSGLGDFYSTGMHGFVTSSALIGCIIGGLISGIMATRLGRRNALIFASVLFFLLRDRSLQTLSISHWLRTLTLSLITSRLLLRRHHRSLLQISLSTDFTLQAELLRLIILLRHWLTAPTLKSMQLQTRLQL